MLHASLWWLSRHLLQYILSLEGLCRFGLRRSCHGNFHIIVAAVFHTAVLHRVSEGQLCILCMIFVHHKIGCQLCVHLCI